MPTNWQSSSTWHLTLFLYIVTVTSVCFAYYDSYQCYGTVQGDCIIATFMQEGGFNDPNYRWLAECQDQEALWGILDFTDNYEGFMRMWCKNQFPLKAPSLGEYPYYPYCTFRDQTREQFYCFDMREPARTYDTFVTGFWDAVDEELSYDPVGMKCCHTPPGYHIDYPDCYYKYTHDAYGEHYRDPTFWLVVCDSAYHVIVGVGQALNPWDREYHYTWIQCCPVIFNPFPPGIEFEAILNRLTIPMGTLDYVPEIYPPDPPILVQVYHNSKITDKYGYAQHPAHNIQYPNISLGAAPSSSSSSSLPMMMQAGEPIASAGQEDGKQDIAHQREPAASPEEFGNRHRDSDKTPGSRRRRKRQAAGGRQKSQHFAQHAAHQAAAAGRKGRRGFGQLKAPTFIPPNPMSLLGSSSGITALVTTTTSTAEPAEAQLISPTNFRTDDINKK